MSTAVTSPASFRTRLADTVARAADHLLSRQREDGHWRFPLETDASITAEYMLLSRHVGRVVPEREAAMLSYLRRVRRPDGSYVLHESGGYSQETTIKAYAAFKAAGVPAEATELQQMRRLILAGGGVESAAVFTKIWLALIGQMSWDTCPIIPPEMAMVPRWSPFNLLSISYWCRVIMVPLSIAYTIDRKGCIDEAHGVAELFRSPEGRVRETLTRGERLFSWTRFFYLGDRFAKRIEKRLPAAWRARAVAAAERWTRERLPHSDGIGGIIPSMMNVVLALWNLGHDHDDRDLVEAWSRLDGLIVEDGDEAWIQPCLSPVWDTGLSLLALEEAGVAADDPRLVRAADWLLARRTTRPGDWVGKASAEVAPSAWAFQYENDFYPDVDDTAVVSIALTRVPGSHPEQAGEAVDGALRWISVMQSTNGGWGAYDRNNTQHVLDHVPFADHGALLDPPTVDLTGRMLGAYHLTGRPDPAAVERAIGFLRDEQKDDGSFWGRWGINYLYGTWSALEGLGAAGLDGTDPMVARAADWLESVQHDDGGWAETPDTYADESLQATGVTTASQTAWALLGLMAAGRADSEAVRRGAEWLVRHQREDGGWDEAEYTGTGFPRVLYLRYHGYPLYFPLMALAKLSASD
ncbi:MAG: squalene--hopene cyclase [Acidobacteriota bacterium]